MQEKESSSFQVVRSLNDLAEGQPVAAHVFIIEESLGHQVNYLARLFTQLLTASLAPYGVYPGQWGVLLFLWVQDGQTQRELSRQVAIDEASMVRSIDRMERDGLVRRVRNEHDRRQIKIFLTEKGLGLRDQLVPCALAGNAMVTQNFTEEEQKQLFALFHRMIASLEDALSSQQEKKKETHEYSPISNSHPSVHPE